MKIRTGFVSNSSSSSFVCDICGCVESGYDLSMSDAGYMMCENGHTFCNTHMKEEFDEHSKDCAESLVNIMKKRTWGDYTKDIKVLEDFINSDYDNLQDFLYDNSDKYKDDNGYNLSEDYFDDEINDLIECYGIPEKYCPLCSKLKEFSKDLEWEKYIELYKKFDGVKPEC